MINTATQEVGNEFIPKETKEAVGISEISKMVIIILCQK